VQYSKEEIQWYVKMVDDIWQEISVQQKEKEKKFSVRHLYARKSKCSSSRIRNRPSNCWSSNTKSVRRNWPKRTALASSTEDPSDLPKNVSAWK